MDKDEWQRLNRVLQSDVTRIEADISKCLESLHLSVKTESGASSQHASTYRKVADARQQLVELQQQVYGEQQANAPAFIAALSEKITSFAQELNKIKAYQRAEYSNLLQQEQHLLEELAPLQLSILEQQQQQQHHDYSSGFAGNRLHTPSSRPAVPHDAGHGSDSFTASSSKRSTGQKMQPGRDILDDPCSTSQSADAALSTPDCICKSPDRPARQQGGSSSSSSSSFVAGHGVAGGSSGSKSTLPPEVQAYDAFLVRHGESGGWHPDDHKTFIKVLKAHRGDYNAALAAAVDALPLQTRQSVIAHCRWHADLCELDMRRRIALVHWRSARDAAKAAWRAQAEALGETCNSTDSDMVSAAITDKQQKESRQLKQQQLQQWKQEQQAAKEAAACAAEQQRRLQQEQQRQQLQERREELRQQLQAARSAKEQAALAAPQQVAEGQHRSAPDPAQLQRLQQRNAAALRRRQQLLSAKQDRLAAREWAQQQLLEATKSTKPQVSRDPSRLLSATAAAAARAAAAEDGKEASAQGSRGRPAGGFVLHVAHKAVPSWRAGMQGL